MVFSSHIFLFFFLSLALLAYYATPRRWRSLVLALESYVFYGWWNPWFTLLMLFTTVVDYYCGAWIVREGASERERKWALAVSITVGLAVLGFFKYALFFADSVSFAAGVFGWTAVEAPDFLRRIVLPVGISFYTFQSMSYAIDLYRGDAKRARNFIDFACYVSMYPQLVAGPIVRYATVAEQLRSRSHTLENFVAGITRFNYGFAKKILLANPAGAIADAVFDAGALSSPLAWAGLFGYAFQIYFDFSAYSDMALGLGRTMGFRFPENFNSPYRSASLSEFWRRWHISLSSFLRDYLYIPLGGNRKGAVRTYANLLFVMLVGGLWHGAQWTFVAWGGVHGLALAVERWAARSRGWSLPRPMAQVVTMAVVLVGWVLFRSPSFGEALAYFSALVGAGAGSGATAVLAATVFAPMGFLSLAVCAVVTFLLPNSSDILRRLTAGKVALGLVLLVVSVRVMGLQGHNPFLYFQF